MIHNEPSQEFLKREFVHFISDSVALLGGAKEIVMAIRDCEEKPLTENLIDLVRGYNQILVDSVKLRLDLMNTFAVDVGG
jgi:hypothetical protein